jgi:hemerythrin-like domain-containing protein
MLMPKLTVARAVTRFARALLGYERHQPDADHVSEHEGGSVMNDPIAILKRDHREAAAMLKELSDSKPGAKRRKTTDKLVAALKTHMEIEESLVYPLIAERVGQEEEHEAEVEHGLARDGLSKLVELVDEGGFGAAVAMVTAGIKHHVKEEETDIFPKLKADLAREELVALGNAVAAKKKRRVA